MNELKERYERTLKSVSLLLANSSEMQRDNLSKKEDIAGISFAKEYCTVKVCGPRQSGHTTVINELVKRFDDKAIVVAYKQCMLEVLESSFKCLIGSIEEMRGSDGIKAVIIDTSSLLSKKNIDRIYEEFSPYLSFAPPFYFIFMQ